jgi:hypothetical protein
LHNLLLLRLQLHLIQHLAMRWLSHQVLVLCH